MALASLLFGVLSTLGPLHLSHAGWGSAAIGGLWLGGAALETIESPLLGRISDRHGRLLPVRVGLSASALVAAGLALGLRPLVYAPLVVLAGMAFGVMNAAWALGAVVGPAAAGAIAGATGDWIPSVLTAGECAVALGFARSRSQHEGAAVVVDRLTGDAAGVRRQ